MTSVTQPVPLELLAAGEEARVYDLEGTADFVHRLEEMGLRTGVLVRMIQPGSPCILAIGNHRFSLRIDDSAVVLVEPVP